MSDMREKYESLALSDLKEIAKVRGIRITGLKKADLIEAMLAEDKKDEEKGKVVEARSIIPGSSPETALEENLNALIELKAFAFLCREKDPSLEDVTLTAYQNLLSSVETPFPTAPPIGLSQICPAVLVKASFLCLQTAALLLRQTGTKEIPYSMLPAAGPI